MKLEADFQEDYFEKSIARSQTEILSAQAPVKQILHSILAELYWQYYDINRWQILQRSETKDFVNDDIKTWDFTKLVAACMENYALSLADKDLLKKTSLSSFSEIIIKQKDSEKFRPTLFDFLAHRAIDFYASAEAGLTKPANTFLLDKPDYFSASNDFAAFAIVSPDTLSFEYQTLKLYQEVIAMHVLDKDPTALVDVELDRLAFVHGNSTLPEKDSLYLAALYKLESRYKNHPSSTEVAYQIARVLDEEQISTIFYHAEIESENRIIPESHVWDKRQAIEVCEAAISRFPDSFGA